MVVLAATVCTKNGKVLVSRQFLEMPQSRIEGLIASFPKLMASGKQHTTIDTEEVRFVYQPLEDLYLVLTTSKKSNILQDIDTLHMFSRGLSEACTNRNVDERVISEHAFDIIHVFDEIVSLGYRENITLSQLRTISLMDSNEERIQEMIAKNKEMEAKEQSRLKAKQMELQKKQMAKLNALQASMGYGQGGSMNSQGFPGFNFNTNLYSTTPSSRGYERETSPVRPLLDSHMKTGMKLGTSKKTSDFSDVFGPVPTTQASPIHEPLQVLQTQTTPLTTTSLQPLPLPSTLVLDPSVPVNIVLEEKLTATVHRDGGLQNMEVKGDLQVQVNQPSLDRMSVCVTTLHPQEGIQFKAHPNIDKSQWTQSSILSLKPTAKSFPLGTLTSVLKWRLLSQDETMLPLSVNCWPTPTNDGFCDVSMEYDLLLPEWTLTDVHIWVPCDRPQVQTTSGTTDYDPIHQRLVWHLPTISKLHANETGSLDFRALGDSPSVFFPVTLQFKSEQLYCQYQVKQIVLPDGGESEYKVSKMCSTENFTIV
ncbi:Coatomer subunit delta [Coelomomyces lativittatus]|nr:Coatomer subunit delta [Coelomomyces lativittatus]